MKITKKITHDKMWIKITNDKEYVRLFIGRNGRRITGRGKNVEEMADRVEKIFQECMDNNMDYKETFDYIEIKFA